MGWGGGVFERRASLVTPSTSAHPAHTSAPALPAHPLPRPPTPPTLPLPPCPPAHPCFALPGVSQRRVRAGGHGAPAERKAAPEANTQVAVLRPRVGSHHPRVHCPRNRGTHAGILGAGPSVRDECSVHVVCGGVVMEGERAGDCATGSRWAGGQHVHAVHALVS